MILVFFFFHQIETHQQNSRLHFPVTMSSHQSGFMYPLFFNFHFSFFFLLSSPRHFSVSAGSPNRPIGWLLICEKRLSFFLLLLLLLAFLFGFFFLFIILFCCVFLLSFSSSCLTQIIDNGVFFNYYYRMPFDVGFDK